ncbi:50S ribosomal protein L10 [Candidatus Woesearchaeota archaeon]|nr:50S ribosomal protein L10 [Candidatus Woesearchaeota archaeon]MBW3018463.1 50S ribosomal protein L10 [Candidatus Woesearchaeota archaeon]
MKAAEWKKRLVQEYVKLIKEYPVVGVVDFTSLPVPQLNSMKAKLRDKLVLKGGRKKLFELALKTAAKDKPGVENMIEFLNDGLPAMIFTKENPFSLYKTLQKSKSNAPAKAGQKAPKDIIVPAGPTSFTPGPIIGELGSAGVKAGIEGGKVVVKADSLVRKEGEVIDAKLAGLLSRLGIQPMEIGLNIIATFENGQIFKKAVLSIDEKQFIDNITKASRWAFNLAMNAGILTKETTEIMIIKAFNEAKALAIGQNILADAVAEQVLAKAEAQAKGLKSAAKLD